jgi:ABC-type dipeptide/oligopeptide/nickel transport system permease subunit
MGITVMAPIIAPFNPNLQFSLSAARNLSPTSRAIVVSRIQPSDTAGNESSFAAIKNLVMREVVDDDYFLIRDVPATLPLKLSEGDYNFSRVVFILGTDEFGRDVFSRLIFAIRLSVLIGIGAVLLSLIFGVSLGFVAGYYAKLTGSILNSITDMFLSFPPIFLVILFLSLYGNTLINVIFVIGFASWMSLFKIVRGEVISIKSKNFIISSTMIGMSKFSILRKEIIPFIFPSVAVNVIFQFANVVIAESSLSFLGLTGNHIYPTLGLMIQEGQSSIKLAWWILFFPSTAIVSLLFILHQLAKRIQSKFHGLSISSNL